MVYGPSSNLILPPLAGLYATRNSHLGRGALRLPAVSCPLPPGTKCWRTHELAAAAAPCPPIRIASASPYSVPTRASAAASEFPRPDHNHADTTCARDRYAPCRTGSGSAGQPSPTRNPLDCAAGSFCPSASPHLAGSALPDFLFRPSTAVHRESLLRSSTCTSSSRCPGTIACRPDR